MPIYHSYETRPSDDLAQERLIDVPDHLASPIDTYLKTRLGNSIHQGLGIFAENFGNFAADTNIYQGYDNNGDPIPNTWLSPEESKQRYGINTDHRMSELAAQRISEAKRIDQQRNSILQRAPELNVMGMNVMPAVGLGTEIIGSFLDPLNIGLSFVPIVGQSRQLMWMKRFGPTAGRLLTGAVEGAVGNAIIEPFVYAGAQALNYDYDEYDSFMNIAMGGIVGAGLHAGLGKFGDFLGISEWSKHVEAGRITPEAHNQALRTSVGQALQDQNVRIHPIIRGNIEARVPSLDSISAIRLIKDAEGSAKVLEEHFAAKDILNRNFDEVAELLTDTERQIMESTSTSDIVEGQIRLGQEINELNAQLRSMQETIDDAHPFQRNTLSNQMASVADQLQEKMNLFNDLLTLRQMFGEADDAAQAGIPLTKRSELDLESLTPESTNELVLNLEKYRDKNLDNIDFSAAKSEADKVLLRRAVLEAQNWNKLDKLTPEELMDIATSQDKLENKWFYDKEAVDNIQQSLDNAPKNYDTTDAEKSLEQTMQQIPPEILEGAEEEIARLDENISLSKKLENGLRTAATCVLESLA